MSSDITHDTAQHRFETRVEGERCTLDYDLRDRTMTITHVNVPDAVGGRGIAAALTETALGYARASGLRVIAQCPYAAHYVREHTAWADIVEG
jgi:predicted GNAT family acetyltransferase